MTTLLEIADAPPPVLAVSTATGQPQGAGFQPGSTDPRDLVAVATVRQAALAAGTPLACAVVESLDQMASNSGYLAVGLSSRTGLAAFYLNRGRNRAMLGHTDAAEFTDAATALTQEIPGRSAAVHGVHVPDPGGLPGWTVLLDAATEEFIAALRRPRP